MARRSGKKESKPSAPERAETFRSNPFNAMKGFSVSAPQQPEPAIAVPPVVTPVTDTEVVAESETDFFQAMQRLGVESLERDAEEAQSDGADQQDEPADDELFESDGSPEAEDRLFRLQMGAMDSSFQDSYAADEQIPPSASARRMKLLRQGRLRPEDSLDLHGCQRDEALKKVRLFLQQRHQQGLKTVLIITGQGLRSPDGEAVLRADVERYLRTRATVWVAEWSRAPRQYGGEGALVVFLRQKTLPQED
ncbi:MAG: Smr/MutS family protein [Desulfuromonadaceae bacterium]|nr:Smr/MutS family protein [Desulfuromonadaceae bacterium]